jgi:diadenosine tetraphosphate (Ap4A) HIT family hydrolase
MHAPRPNKTLLKFGYPDSLIHQGRHWAVLARPAQPTLGSLVLCAMGGETSYGDLPEEAFAEQHALVGKMERSLRSFSRFEKINYLMLMMVDPHVHFHVLPRYEGERHFDGVTFSDKGWPGLPDLAAAQPSSPALVEHLRQAWQPA